MEKLSFVMDRGFYSEQNINELMKCHHKFLIGVRCNLKLVSGHRNPAHEKEYERYFDVHETPKRGLVVTVKEDVIRQKKKNFGYYALLSNGIKDSVEAIKIYRNKDLIEKLFGNLKERLDMRRMFVASEENFEGKLLFIQFVALMYISYIKRQMDEHGLFKNFTMQTLLDELDIIEQYQQPGHESHISEVTKKQVALYKAMDVGLADMGIIFRDFRSYVN